MFYNRIFNSTKDESTFETVCGSVRHCYVGFVEHGEHSEDERDHFLHFIEPFSETKETGWLWSTQFRQENLGMFIDFYAFEFVLDNLEVPYP